MLEIRTDAISYKVGNEKEKNCVESNRVNKKHKGKKGWSRKV